MLVARAAVELAFRCEIKQLKCVADPIETPLFRSIGISQLR